MQTINLTINGKNITAPCGQTILQIATDNGIVIPNLCYDPNLKNYGACGLCLVEVKGNSKLLRACATSATDGMVIHTESPRIIQARRIALELIMSDHEGDCLGPCTLNCPAGTNCQGYLKQIALGNDYEAVKIMKDKLPIPASIGRICPHPCETACRRKLVEEPVSIAQLKSFAADRVLTSDNPYKPEVMPASGEKVAIVGGGPGGLTAAYYLAVKGHAVTIYDAMPQMGGMLRYGIPEYRLPKKILDAEIKEIADLGVVMQNNVRVGKDISLVELKAKNYAVLVAIGAWKSSKIGCPGEGLQGVMGGIDFLREVAMGEKPEIGDNVVVVGGGNTAMDACRTAVRLGAKHVYIVYRRTQDEAPAEEIEIEEAKEEGVIFRFLTNPAEIIGKNGKVKEIKLQIMQLGEPDASGRRSPIPVEGKFETLPVDTVIAAIGQKINLKGLKNLEQNRWGNICADEKTFRTSLDGIFAVGDATNNGADIAITAIGEAQKAAEVIDSYLNGMEIPYKAPYVSEKEVSAEMFADRKKQARIKMPTRPAEERTKDFNEVNCGFDEDLARKDAARCLECGCHAYGDCKLIDYANWYDLDVARMEGEKHPSFMEDNLVSIERDQGKCILCNLCVRVCDEVVEKSILGLVDKGFHTVIKAEFNNPATIDYCKDCQKCAQICPTGALKILSCKNR